MALKTAINIHLACTILKHNKMFLQHILKMDIPALMSIFFIGSYIGNGFNSTRICTYRLWYLFDVLNYLCFLGLGSTAILVSSSIYWIKLCWIFLCGDNHIQIFCYSCLLDRNVVDVPRNTFGVI